MSHIQSHSFPNSESRRFINSPGDLWAVQLLLKQKEKKKKKKDLTGIFSHQKSRDQDGPRS